MKIFTVVGARPQFVKAAVVSREIRNHPEISEVIVHTGQHYDKNMSQLFFDELDIPFPKRNLGISGGSHAQMTARMLINLEEAIKDESPDCVLLYGDTNSTLAGALAAAKLHIPIVHVEAGARTHSKNNPEEINRICTDHVSTLLLACTQGNLGNLALEGLADSSAFVGDPMLDAFKIFGQIAQRPTLTMLEEKQDSCIPDKFYYMTCHREENTAERNVLENILYTMNGFDYPVLYPVHPRNRQAIIGGRYQEQFSNVIFIEPIGYLESIWCVNNCLQVITDSGGLQREAFFAGVKCTTILDFEVWPETMVGNRNILASPNSESILSAMGSEQMVDPEYQPFGAGNAAMRIVESIMSNIGELAL